MRQGQQSRRGRNRGRKPQSAINRSYESSGPDVKIRGSAMHIAEKYASLARDAMASGDSVAAENYLQHAEHYNRIILAAQAQSAMEPHAANGGRFNQPDAFQRDFDTDSEETESDDYLPQRPAPGNLEHRGFHERANYNQHQQPQPYVPQNAFQHAAQPQPVIPPGNGAQPPYQAADNFSPAPGGDRLPRRRRRRPMGDPQARGYNGGNGVHGEQPPNGLSGDAPDTPADEPAS